MYTSMCPVKIFSTVVHVVGFSYERCQTASVVLEPTFFHTVCPCDGVSSRTFHINPPRSILFCKMRVIRLPK